MLRLNEKILYIQGYFNDTYKIYHVEIIAINLEHNLEKVCTVKILDGDKEGEIRTVSFSALRNEMDFINADDYLEIDVRVISPDDVDLDDNSEDEAPTEIKENQENK